jgi:hypothetical protein
MAKPYSEDLRRRVVEAIDGGLPYPTPPSNVA